MSRVAVGLVVLLAGAAAGAQAQRVSEATAGNRSLWGTLVPAGLGYVMLSAAYGGSGEDATAGGIGVLAFTGGLVVGPSLGYFYAGQSDRAWGGILIRTLGFGMVAGAAAASWDCSASACDAFSALGAAGFAVMLGSAIYDIATVKKAVRRRNGAAAGIAVAVAPTYSAPRHAAGLSVRITF